MTVRAAGWRTPGTCREFDYHSWPRTVVHHRRVVKLTAVHHRRVVNNREEAKNAVHHRRVVNNREERRSSPPRR